MQAAAKAENEGERLAFLRNLEILDTGPESEFDEVTELAAKICQVPICVISLIDESRQWFKSKIGLQAKETGRDIAFCAHAILNDFIMVVPDATKDPRFFDNPLVVDGPKIRFYAGAPITVEGKYRVGTLCVIDHTPRNLSQDQLRALRILANQVGGALKLRYRDQLQKKADAIIEQNKLQIVATAKMSALGLMAGGIAHEINNPLSIILSRAGQLVDLTEADKLDKKNVAEIGSIIERTCLRISKSIRALRAFARDGENDRLEIVSLRSIVADTLELCQQKFSEGQVKLTVHQPAEEINLECRPITIAQVLLNLLNNAYDAVEGSADPRISIDAKIHDGLLELSVSDSGAGVPSAIRERIMEPFFTTKPVGKGTGLGLSISQRILHAHGGTIFLAEGPSTRFVMRMPLRQLQHGEI